MVHSVAEIRPLFPTRELPQVSRVLPAMVSFDVARRCLAILLVSLCVLAGCSTPRSNKQSRNGPAIPRPARVAILQLGGPGTGASGSRILGIDIDAGMIARFREDLDAEQPDLVIVSVNAGSESLQESVDIARELESIESSHRTIVWIRAAVTQSVFAIWGLDELYMHSQAYMGASTHSCWSFNAPSFQEILDAADRASAAGQRDPLILRSIVFPFPLSATRIGDTVLWFQSDKEGELLVNREQEMLCFNSHTASECGVSKGTADDVASLCRLVGIESYEIVSKDASERFVREADERFNWTQRLHEEVSRCQAISHSMAEMISIGTASKVRYAEAKSDVEASLDRLSELAKQYPRLAHKLDVEKLEGEPTKKRQRWFLPEAREGLAELSRRSQ